MVTNFPDFGSALDDWLEGLRRIARGYQGLRWRDIHPIVLREEEPYAPSRVTGYRAKDSDPAFRRAWGSAIRPFLGRG